MHAPLPADIEIIIIMVAEYEIPECKILRAGQNISKHSYGTITESSMAHIVYIHVYSV